MASVAATAPIAGQRAGTRSETIAFLADGRGADRRAVLRLSAVPDAGAVLRAVRLRVQPADRLRRAAVVRPRALFRLGELSRGACRQGAGAVSPELAILAGAAGRGRARPDRRLARDPPPGHLLRDDHARARADDVLLRAAGEVHRRRGRHPGRAARQAVRRDRPVEPHDDVLRSSLVDLPRRASCSFTASSTRRSARC